MPFEILELQRNVADGAELLDNDLGREGWAELIDVELLDMGDARFCVLGQVYEGDPSGRSGYTVGLDALGLDLWADEDDEYGFNIPLSNPGVTGGMPARWEILRQLWLFQITIRTAD